ncbi:hypothetical protein WN51_00848 [Melipona quadrifasciata]|uniref:Uncharacterized protein n=1 Tax=Melipona quadrifasciata TaxID=166423 RepID=A0A0M9AB79_9HYME|nr:hypothetical protein WN51_00848 [Melipona quadrifasciata]
MSICGSDGLTKSEWFMNCPELRMKTRQYIYSHIYAELHNLFHVVNYVSHLIARPDKFQSNFLRCLSV